MSYARPTLTVLRSQVVADIKSGLPGSDPLLRFSSLSVLGNALAGLAQLQYGYTDYVALQSNPLTATDEFLEAWAALKKIYREAATQAGASTPGQVSFTTSQAGLTISAGDALVRGDGVAFTATADAVSVGTAITVLALANADSTGLTGAFGNTAVGTSMTLATAVAGISSTGQVTVAFTGGADIEDDDSLRSRMLEAYQNPPQGGAQADYVTWALEVNGVTRAWCNPNGFGAGTVVVYVMLDSTESANNGFPVGANGVAAAESRGVAATGDQLTVANYIYPLRPATALVYVCAPTQMIVNFTISGTTGFTAAIKTSIESAIAGIFVIYGSPLSGTVGSTANGTVDLSYIESAIAAISGTTGFVITSPTANIVGTTGQLPVLGVITWL